MSNRVLMVGVLAAAASMFCAADWARADNLYFAGIPNGSTWNFGTLDSAGHATNIATGLSFGGAVAEKLMFAPDGTLYGLDVGGPFSSSGAWGRINPATGAFTQIGNLNSVFGGGYPFEEFAGYSFAFGPSGTLYATGYNQYDSGGNFDFGTLSLTTGAFTKIAGSPVGYAGSLASAVPEPSTFVLLGIGAIGLVLVGWRRKRPSVAVLLVVFGALIFSAADRVWAADNFYYVSGGNDGSHYTLAR